MYERSDQIEQLYFQRPRIKLRCRARSVRQAQELQQQKQRLLGRRDRPEPVDDAAARNVDRILAPNPEDIAQQFQHWLEGRGSRVSQDPPLVDANALPPAIFGKLKTEAALANPGFSDNTDHSTIALRRLCEFEFEGGEMLAASDQGS